MTEKRGVFEELCVEIECESERKLVDGCAAPSLARDVENRQRRRRPVATRLSSSGYLVANGRAE
jgi:hypothetical protein